ncbi:MAG: mechanosensitive ion channel family protein [Calditrichaeota bacterium]|nr:MAG: mechanosensitive ion channel family protein [Calditrichota bacterium]
MSYEYYINFALESAIVYLPKVFLAIVTLVIGLQVIRWVVLGFQTFTEKARPDTTLQKFSGDLLKIFLKGLLLLSVLSMVGIKISSFIALLGAVFFAISLAFQGTLRDVAGGILLVFYKPFKVGDVIQAHGVRGKVDSIEPLHTVLKTPDNTTVMVPNRELSNASIVNLSTESLRRLDLTVRVGYENDIERTKLVLTRILDRDPRIPELPTSTIVIAELGESSVHFEVRIWCNGADYWAIYFDTLEEIKSAFDEARISIPYPRVEVHLQKTE